MCVPEPVQPGFDGAHVAVEREGRDGHVILVHVDEQEGALVLEVRGHQLVQAHGRPDDLEAVHLLVGLADQDQVGEQQAVHSGSHLGCLGLLHPQAGVREETPGLALPEAWHGGQQVEVAVILLD
ncbi:hypothetical protein EGW08_013161, partial [Elysia chlorotica]